MEGRLRSANGGPILRGESAGIQPNECAWTYQSQDEQSPCEPKWGDMFVHPHLPLNRVKHYHLPCYLRLSYGDW